MSKATAASNGFGAISPSARNAIIKQNLKSNSDLISEDINFEKTVQTKNNRYARGSSNSQKVNLSDLIYDHLSSDKKQRKQLNNTFMAGSKVPRISSPVQRKVSSNEDSSLMNKIQPLKRIHSANRTSGRPRAKLYQDRNTAAQQSTTLT